MRLSRWRVSSPVRWAGLLVCAAALGAAVLLRLHDLKPVRGVVTSTGEFLDTWSAAPDGCAIDPQDAIPAGRPASVVSILWDDPTLHDPIRGTHWLTVPDAPLRLDLTRAPGGQIKILLSTVKLVDPEVIDGESCPELKLAMHGESPLVKGAGPSVGGTLDLDCRTPDRRLTAHLKFARCGL